LQCTTTVINIYEEKDKPEDLKLVEKDVPAISTPALSK